MKHSLFSISLGFLILLLIFISCTKKDDLVQGELEWPYFQGASALINDEKWEADFVTFTKNNNNLYYLVLKEHEWVENLIWASRTQISIRNIRKVSNSKIKLTKSLLGSDTPTAFIYTSSYDGDAITGIFDLLSMPSNQNWIEIFEINEENGTMSGSLQASFLLRSEYPFNITKYTDTIIVRNCKFRAVRVK